jgi:membrane protease YdiL (CAAX protease family)
MSSEQTPTGGVARRGWSGSQRAWFTAFAMAASLTLLIDLGRRHYAAHTLGGRILGAVFGGLVLALVLRGLIYVFVPGWREGHDRQHSPSQAAPGGLIATRPWGAGYAFAALIAVFVALSAIGFALQAAHVVTLPLGVGTLIVEGLFLVALVPLRRRCGIHASDIGLRSTSGPRGVGLVVAGAVAVAVLTGIYVAAVRPGRGSGSFEGLGHHSAATIAVACFASIIAAPFAEEIFFRGLLYGGLRNRLPVVPAALIVAVVFGLGHTQYPLLVRPEMAIFGFIACLLYERTRSLLPSMGLHSLHNALAVTLALGGPVGLVVAGYVGLGLLVSAPAGYRALHRGVARRRVPTAGAGA